ncbi:MAG: ATP-binding protein [Micrococcaceae bacterium]
MDEHREILFREYLRWGGFPSVATGAEYVSETALEGIYSSILLKDVAHRGNIRDIKALERVSIYLLDTTGNKISINSISEELDKEGIKISAPTIDHYVKLLQDSFIFFEALRYDVKGKHWLKTNAKRYVIDTGLRNAVLGKEGDLGAQLENLVYIELLRRGYRVFVGKLPFKNQSNTDKKDEEKHDSKEVNFVASKHGVKEYYQVTYQMPRRSTREQDNLLLIRDGYRKTIITSNMMDVGVIDGIPVVHAIDWLLGSKGSS